ncbi:MAG: DUF3015 family protein [Candidatus Eisenbacteria bacterium]
MKKLALLALAGMSVLTFAGSVQANQKNTGCGLGSLIFKDQDGLLSQVCAATFNGIYGNQTFAISTGTSNCEKATSFTSNERLNKFVDENMDNLAIDISRGNGEYLTTLAVLIDTPVEQRAEFYRTLQANFSAIYTSDAVTTVDVLSNIEKVLHRAS